MTQKIKTILVVGVLLRLLVAPFTYHSDTQPFDLAGYVISQGYVLNFYDFFPGLSLSDPRKHTFHDYNFNYPPAVYFSLGGVANLFSPLVGDQFRYEYLFNVQPTLGSVPFFIHQFSMKLPYLIFDLGVAFLLMKLFETEKQKTLAVALWMFNPLSIYSSFMVGGFDIIPTFFTVLALYFVRKDENPRNLYLAALAIGLGTAFKVYPLYLLIPLMSLTSKWMDRIKIAVLGILPYFVFALPFLGSHNFRSSALLASQSTKSFIAQILVSGGESIILLPAILIFFYLVFLRNKIAGRQLWSRFLTVLILLFIFTEYHPQWFLWITPFLIIELIYSNFKNILALGLIFMSFIFTVLLYDQGLSLGLFSPLNPALYNSFSIWDVYHLHPDINLLRSYSQTVFVGAALYYLYIYSFRHSDQT